MLATQPKKNMFGRLLLIGIIIPMFIMEWNYTSVAGKTTLPLILSYPAWLLGPAILAFSLMTRRLAMSPAARSYLNIFLFLCLWFFFVLTVQGLFVGEFAGSYSKFDLLQLLFMPIWGLAGFWFADDVDSGEWLLSKFALFAAFGSLFSFTLRVAGIPDTVLFGMAGWPVRLFFLFGFCWYLARLLGFADTSLRNLLGLGACSLEVLLTLHKPIIWSASFVLMILVLVFWARISSYQFRRLLLTWFKSAAAIAIILLVANSFTHGFITEQVNKFVYVRVLHRPEGTDLRYFKPTLEQATGGRFKLWEAALSDPSNNLWVGSGFHEVEVQSGLVSVHNGYLDLVLTVGILGAIPVAYGLGLWVVRVMQSLKFERILMIQASCLAYLIGILMFNLGGTSRLFVDVSYFVLLVGGVSLRLAVDYRAQAQQEMTRLAAGKAVSHLFLQTGNNKT